MSNMQELLDAIHEEGLRKHQRRQVVFEGFFAAGDRHLGQLAQAEIIKGGDLTDELAQLLTVLGATQDPLQGAQS